MGFKAPFLVENQPKPLYNFSFHKVQRQTKSVLVDMIKNFFDSINKVYQLQMPEIIGVKNSEEATKVFVNRDFPYGERTIPIIIVGIKSAVEKKMYIGADNLVGYVIRETSSGKTAVELYHGAATVTTALIVVTDNPESRMQLVELLNMCFTHYYRWQYFYTLGDGDMFSIVPNTSELEFGTESEADTDSPDTKLYVTDLTMTSHIEYSFRDLDVLGELKDYNILDESGPVAE